MDKSKLFITKDSYIIHIINTQIMTKRHFDVIWKNKPNHEHTITIFGKTHKVPRTQVMYGEHSYTFSGNTLEPIKEIPDYVEICFDFVRELRPNVNWNGALVNFYEDGTQYIGPHSDDEKELDNNEIWSFSFGETRIFRIRNKKTKKKVIDYQTPDNSVIVMGGRKFQEELTHEIPKQKHKGRRINVTIRSFK